MKQLSQVLTLFSLVLLFNTSCKKKDVAPIDQLPAATQEGKNTFGCLIDGKAFTPGGSMFSGPSKQSYYELIDGKYYFHVSAADQRNVERIYEVNINTNGLAIKKGAVIPLKEGREGEPEGAYAIFDRNGPDFYYRTSTTTTGELTITHFDLGKQIVSGIFWFDAVNEEGKKVEVREGRFDMQFTR